MEIQKEKKHHYSEISKRANIIDTIDKAILYKVLLIMRTSNKYNLS